jgi:predicted DNA-binding transcriptional regulator YafY
VLARQVAKDRIGTFAMSRFRRLEATGQTFTRPAEFSPETYARKAFGIVGGEAPIKVRLLFEPKLAVYITERQWHPSQEFRARPDGRVEMRMETTGRKELVRWVLSWMPDVKVLAPKSLRDRIVEKLRDGLRAQQ